MRNTLSICFSTLVFMTAAVLTNWLPSPAQAANSMTCLNGLTCLNQGWTDEQRTWWYRTTQGSRLLPLSWMLSLELADGTDKFMSPEHMGKLGYLPEPASISNPWGLPVGFTEDQDRTSDADVMCDTFPNMCANGTMRQKWVGMNCSACHTNDIQIGNKKLRIEGAPTLADFQGLEESLLKALKALQTDQTKFDRFAGGVFGGPAGPDAKSSLRLEVDEQVAWQQRLFDKNDAPNVRYGPGRLDAQGHILNKVALVAGAGELITKIKADAPASYPFIWNTSQQTKIQWNGIATNKARIPFFDLETDLGALIRNTSEVIGVFAHIEIKDSTALEGYRTSARVRELISLERRLATLQSPQWPSDLLGPINEAKRARGDALFDEMCKSCHSELRPTDTTSPMAEKMNPIQKQKTDIFLACNTYFHTSKTGDFKGQRPFIVPLLGGAKMGDEALTRNMLVNATFGTILGKKNELLDGMFNDVFSSPEVVNAAAPRGELYLPGVTDPDKIRIAKQCLNAPANPKEDILAYKARSLNGIWATAPYLHNGSVPTLYDLLSTTDLKLRSTDKLRSVDGVPEPDAAELTPERRRPDVFSMGTRIFDPVKVGFATAPEAEGNGAFTFRVKEEATSKPIPGNYNSGHDYGTSRLSEADRMSLVEYLKSL
jgi:hypothetical protein